MSQNTTVESPTPTSSHPSINPVLQAALGSLDVQLEEELVRYRRQRTGRPVMSPSGLGRHQLRKPIELIAVDKGEGANKNQPPALGMSTAPKIEFPMVMVNQTPDEQTNGEVAQSDQLDPPSSAYIESLVDPSQTSRIAHDSVEGMTEPMTAPEQSAGLGGGLVPLTETPSQPEDYLESSEKLLQSLSQEEDHTRSQKGFMDRVLSPLGVGSILLLLLSSATLVYVLRHPSTLSALNPSRIFGSNQTTTAQNSTKTEQTKSTPAENPPPLKGPNLASEEFPEVSLDTLSHLEPSPTESVIPTQPEVSSSQTIQSVSPITPNSSVSGSSSDVSSALLPTPGQSQTVPSTVVPVAPLPPLPSSVTGGGTPSVSSVKSKPLSKPATPDAKQTSSAKQKSAPAASLKGNLYYVLVNYSSDRDLEQAKKVVPDAYVERLPQGTRIHMGAFKLESQAKSLVEQLKKQGVTASVYHP